MIYRVPAPRDFFALTPQEQWQAHCDAGRLGGNPPCPPDVRARRDAREQQMRRLFGR